MAKVTIILLLFEAGLGTDIKQLMKICGISLMVCHDDFFLRLLIG